MQERSRRRGNHSCVPRTDLAVIKDLDTASQVLVLMIFSGLLFLLDSDYVLTWTCSNVRTLESVSVSYRSVEMRTDHRHAPVVDFL